MRISPLSADLKFGQVLAGGDGEEKNQWNKIKVFRHCRFKEMSPESGYCPTTEKINLLFLWSLQKSFLLSLPSLLHCANPSNLLQIVLNHNKGCLGGSEWPTLDFGSGLDLRVLKSSPGWDSVSAWNSLSPYAPPLPIHACSISLSLKNQSINHNKNCPFLEIFA